MRDRARKRGHGAVAGGRKPGARAPKQVSEARLLAEARKTQRESRMIAQRRARRLRVVAAIVAVMALLGGCYGLYASPLFSIRTVEVVGNSHVSTPTVLALARVPANATLIRFPATDVAARVAADPWVASVAVSRVFPSGMRIRIVERVPVAAVSSATATSATANGATAMWLADGSGMIIAQQAVAASGTLPVIQDVPGLDLKPGRRTTSEPLLNALKVLAGISRQLAATVKSISAPSVDGATLLRADRVEIVIGEAVDLATKSGLAQTILAQQRGKVVSIDVRIVDRPTWRGLK